MNRIIAIARSLFAVQLFGIAMFSLGGIWTALLIVMGEQFIHKIMGGIL